MAAIYEFQVTGQVGSVVRAALPEMQIFEEPSGRILRGIATERREIDRLLERIQLMNLTVQRLHICRRSCSRLRSEMPVVDDGGTQHDVLE